MKIKSRNSSLLLALATFTVFGTCVANAAIITFDDIAAAHGQIIDDEYFLSHGLTISANNVGGGPNSAVAFNTDFMGSTSDPDLLGPWAGGNLQGEDDAGYALIIQESYGYDSTNDVYTDPDDEASRPAGTLKFEFASAISYFGFDLIDVEGPSEYGADSGFFAVFFNDGSEIGRVGFGDLIDNTSPFYQADVEYDNNFANRINPFTPAQLGVAAFDEVHINFGGSAAVDNLVFDYVVPIPAPAGLALLGMGITAVLSRRRKRAA